MSESDHVHGSVEKTKTFMELRGLRPNTKHTFAGCGRRLLAAVDKSPAAVKAADVEGFLLDLVRKGRSPRTRNVDLQAGAPGESRLLARCARQDRLQGLRAQVGLCIGKGGQQVCPGDGKIYLCAGAVQVLEDRLP